VIVFTAEGKRLVEIYGDLEIAKVEKK